MQVEVFKDLNTVPKGEWTTCVKNNFYSSISYLQILNKSGVENAEYRYLIVYESDHPVGVAVLSRFYLNLDLLAGIPIITKLKKRWPKLLRQSMICCGIPSSFGQLNVHVTDESFRLEIIECIHQEMVRWSKESNTRLLVWKEFIAGDPAIELLNKSGYKNLPTLPDNILENLPNNTNDFLTNLRSPYRRRYNPMMTLLKDGNVKISGSVISLEVKKFETKNAEDFYKGYYALMGRTPVMLERYPSAFFTELAEGQGDEITLYKIKNELNDQDLSALVVDKPEFRYFILVSKLEKNYELSLYTNLLRCLVLGAIDKGVNEIHLGQTSDYAKMTCGSRQVRLETCIQFTKPRANRIFHRFGNLLFPDRKFKEIHVFK